MPSFALCHGLNNEYSFVYTDGGTRKFKTLPLLDISTGLLLVTYLTLPGCFDISSLASFYVFNNGFTNQMRSIDLV